jgi:hypothetical protein
MNYLGQINGDCQTERARKSRKPRQLSLFDMPTLNVMADYKTALNEAARKSGMSRDHIVDAMNQLADRYGVRLTRGRGKRLTVETLEKWLSINEERRVMPVQALPVFCEVVRDYAPLNVIARPLGLSVIGPEEEKLLRWARLKMKQKADAAEMRAIEKDIL